MKGGWPSVFNAGQVAQPGLSVARKDVTLGVGRGPDSSSLSPTRERAWVRGAERGDFGGRGKERWMSNRMRGPLAILLVTGIVLAATGNGWGQQETSRAPAKPDDSPGLTAMAAVAGAIGSFLYVPFKAGAICPGMALASGVSLATTGGNRATADSLLRAGCEGTYFITPGMVRGQEEFQGSGAR